VRDEDGGARDREAGGAGKRTRKKIRALTEEEKDRRASKRPRADARRRVDEGVGARETAPASRGTEKSAAGAGPPLGAGSTREPASRSGRNSRFIRDAVYVD